MFAVIIFGVLLSSATDIVQGNVLIRLTEQNNGQVNSFAFYNLDYNKTKDNLFKLVTDGQYDNAVDLIKYLDKTGYNRLITETIDQLLESHSAAKVHVMSFAYQLWNSAAKDLVRKYFPASFKNILDQDYVKIVNKGYSQALKLDGNTDNDGDRLAWGDSKDKSSNRVSWKFFPVWENDQVTFKVYNVDTKMYLKSAVATDHDGDRRTFASYNADTLRHRYYLEPHVEDRELVFFIINYKYAQGLKLVWNEDSVGDRALMGHKGDIYKQDEGRFRWSILPW